MRFTVLSDIGYCRTATLCTLENGRLPDGSRGRTPAERKPLALAGRGWPSARCRIGSPRSGRHAEDPVHEGPLRRHVTTRPEAWGGAVVLEG